MITITQNFKPTITITITQNLEWTISITTTVITGKKY